MEFLLYFAGPVIFAVVGARLLGQRFRVAVIGFAAFLIAWIVMQTIASVSLQALGLREEMLLYALIVSLSAGLIEESTRFVVFRQFDAFRDNRDWRSALTYALGHHGMEVFIVGLSLALTYLVVRYKPDAISDPVLLQRCRDTAALGTGGRIYNASERLFVGLLIHTCFSAVVMLSFVRRQRRWLFVAMAWHFAHDMVAFNLHRISSHWLVGKAWIAIIVIGYSYLAVRLYRALRRAESRAAASDTPTPPTSMMLPGRLLPKER